MHPFHPSVLGALGAQHGVASAKQLEELGLSRRQVTRMVTAGQLTVAHRSVFRLAGFPVTFESMCAAASLADENLAVSHQSAARLSGIRQMTTARLHVTAPCRRRPIAPGDVIVHRSRMFIPDHIVVRADKIRVTSVARTLFDLASAVGADRLESAVEHALQLQLVAYQDLADMAAQMTKRGRSGSRRFATLIESRPVTQIAVDSNDELVLERALIAAGLAAPVRQYELRPPNQVPIHPDLAWPDIRWAVEVDHRTWHETAEATAADNARDRQVRMLSWEVERVSDREIRRNLPGVVRDLRKLHAIRLANITH
jgi:hypothetical protein